MLAQPRESIAARFLSQAFYDTPQRRPTVVFAMRDHLVFYLNGQRRTAEGSDGLATVTDHLRDTLRQVGTKVVCAEGDCGACSVLVGRPSGDGRSLTYRTIDACIAFVYQLDRTHLVTVEGLKHDDHALTPVQAAMVEGHGSQCGFCTPGFVVTMHGLFEPGGCDPGDGPGGCEQRPVGGDHESNGRAPGDREAARLNDHQLRRGLSGNLCRCTGYQQIIDAGKAIDPATVARMNERYPASPMLEDFAALGDASVLIEADIHGQRRQVFLPADLREAVAFRGEHPGCVVSAGTTDLGVQHNHGRPAPDVLLSLTHAADLGRVAIEDGVLITGSAATWSRIEHAVRDAVPEYHRILTRFGSPQVRNAGTLGGNLANASPIADSIPFHLVMDAELDLASPRGTRAVKLNDFYLGYKQLDLKDDELLVAVRTPMPAEGQRLKLYKVSKRRDMDISTFTAAVLLTLDEPGDTIVEAKIAYGGVAATVLRLPKTEAFLEGQPFTEDTMREAGRIARTEIAPLSDVRGSADFRLQLAENILVKAYHDLTPTEALVH